MGACFSMLFTSSIQSCGTAHLGTRAQAAPEVHAVASLGLENIGILSPATRETNACWVYNRSTGQAIAFNLWFKDMRARRDLDGSYLTSHGIIADALNWPRRMCVGGSIQAGVIRYNSGTLQGIQDAQFSIDKVFAEVREVLVTQYGDKAEEKWEKMSEEDQDIHCNHAVQPALRKSVHKLRGAQYKQASSCDDLLHEEEKDIIQQLLFNIHVMQLEESGWLVSGAGNWESLDGIFQESIGYLLVAWIAQLPEDVQDAACEKFGLLLLAMGGHGQQRRSGSD